MSAIWRIEEHLTARDIRLLEDLERYRLLTTRQIQRLRLPAVPFGSHVSTSAATRGTTRILNRLEDLGVVTRLERRIGGTKHGSANTVWQLGATGERYLRTRQGLPRRRRFDEPSLTFIAHTIATRDIAVTVIENAAHRSYDVLTADVEPHCWRTFTTGTGTTTLRPDLFVVTADPTTETHSFVEVDLDTEHLPALIRKCRLYQRYFRTGIEQQARGLFPAIVWLVPTSKRARQLHDAIANARDLDADLFWITTTDQALAHLAPYTPPEHTSGNATT